TLSLETAQAAAPRIALLIARAEAGDCDLVARGTLGNRSVGFMYVGGGSFQTDRRAAPRVSSAVVQFLGLWPRQEITYTCTPPGSGHRMAIDRDEDGFLDGDEADAGSDPADPHDIPSWGYQ